MRDVEQTWADFLNPDVVRQKLTMVGLFMVAHEFLVDCIRDRPLRFFSDEFRDGLSIPSEAYKAKVLALYPKNKLDAWRGGIEWLKRMDVIDETDEIVIQEVRKVRNVMAHELRNIIGGGSFVAPVGGYRRLVMQRASQRGASGGAVRLRAVGGPHGHDPQS